MSVDVLDDCGMRPELIPIQVTDATHLRLNVFEENFDVSSCGIVLCDTLPQILLKTFDIDLIEIVIIDRLDANDLIGQEIR